MLWSKNKQGVEELLEENDNQIDSQLSDIPPAGDENNATPQEKAARIGERKKRAAVFP